MKSDELGGVVRTLLAAAAGFAATKGWADEATAQMVAGAIGTLLVAGWSIRAKRKARG